MFCPFNLLAFWKTFVLPLNCNNLTTIVRGILVLLSIITFYSLCMLNFKTIQSQFLCKHSLEFFFPVIPRLSLCLFYPINSIRLFRQYLSSNSVSLSWTYFGSISYLYISWISLSNFSLLFTTLSTFSSKLFCVNSKLFLKSLISFFNRCIFCIISLKLPLIKLFIFSAYFLISS